MPGAETGSEDNGLYTYLVAASVQQVTDFYKVEMPKLGWQLGGSGGNNSTIQSILVYRGAGGLLVIGINPHGAGSIVAISVK